MIHVMLTCSIIIILLHDSCACVTLSQRKTQQHRAQAAAMQLGHELLRKGDGTYVVRVMRDV